MSTACRISDVAAAAKVSVATVSNVLNFPHKVKPQTRSRVEAVIEMLGYQRSEAAYLLRHGARKKSGGEWLPASQPRSAPQAEFADANAAVAAQLSPASGRGFWPKIRVGSEVVMCHGGFETAGVVDAVMPDGSAIWVWTSNGAGRRLVHREDGITVKVVDDGTPGNSEAVSA